MAKNKAESEILHVIARAPFHAYFDGPALSLSGTNRVGTFSVLPGHADFFSMLTPGDIEIATETDTTTFTITSGLVTVQNNNVYLFVNV